MQYRPRLTKEENDLIQKLRNSKKTGEHYDKGIWVVSGCWHFPFHNKEMFESFLHLISELELTGFILIGDILDMNSISKNNILGVILFLPHIRLVFLLKYAAI